jgi:cation diffusion facilitator CzcD-associated flavoprotein CzcO
VIVIVGGGFGSLLMGGCLREAGFDDICVIGKGGTSAAPGAGIVIRARCTTSSRAATYRYSKSSTASKELARQLTRHEPAELMEMAGYRKMESVRRAG